MTRHETSGSMLGADHPDGVVQTIAGPPQDEATAPAALPNQGASDRISDYQPPRSTQISLLDLASDKPISSADGEDIDDDDNDNNNDNNNSSSNIIGLHYDASLLIPKLDRVAGVDAPTGVELKYNDVPGQSSKQLEQATEIIRSANVPSPLVTYPLTVPADSPGSIVGFQAANHPPEAQSQTMIFSSAQDRHRRRIMATTSCLSLEEANLTSKDRAKQKDAIKRILASRVKDDWDWVWPQESDAQRPLNSGLNHLDGQEEPGQELEWRERDEWESNASESGDENITSGGAYPDEKHHSKIGGGAKDKETKDPFRFSSPDGVGETLRQKAEERKLRRRKRLLDEMKVNDGVACFTHRRDAWTGARYVRRSRLGIKGLPKDGASPESEKKSALSEPSDDDDQDLITQIPLAPPILPPNTPIRAGITEKVYTTIYDKVIIQAQTPICPINLSVIMKSCVEGWKRDGEWPPKATEPEPGMRKIASKEENGKERSVLRRSLQKVFGVVRGPGDRKNMQ